MSIGFRMHAERTPNPNSIKWVLAEPIAEPGVTAHFEEPVGEDVSPLAARLFGVKSVTGVFFASRFITVTKAPDVEWTDIAQDLVDAIKAHASSGDPPVGPAFEPIPPGPESEISERICELLDREIRPAVAMDGGDVVFAGYRDGRVELHLHGSCSGCPSATATLKLGIESRLREEIPEIREVVAI